MENTIAILKQVEKTHKNLGLPLIFAKLVDLSDLGLFLIAERGKGKTTVLDMIRDTLRHRDVMEVSIISYAGLNKMADEMTNKQITMINRDFSTFYTDYLKDVAVNFISAIITDHSIKADTGKYHLKIENCYISFLSATQPQMLEKINRIPTWESMYRDRFLRFPMLYWFGTPKYVKEPPKISPISLISDLDVVKIPSSIRDISTYNRMVAVLERQTSEGRCRQYTDTLLKAHAALNGRDIVISKDLEFLKLFAGNLIVDYLLSDRERGVSNPLVLNANSFVIFSYLLEHNGASKSQIRQEFNVSSLTIQRNINPLMAKNLVKGSYGKDFYVINPKWLEKYANPVYDWFREYGIYE